LPFISKEDVREVEQMTVDVMMALEKECGSKYK